MGRTVLKELKTVQTLATITKNVVAGVRAAVDVWTTRNLIDDIRQGTPTLIIEGVRKQIKSHGLWSVLGAVGDALTVGMNVLLPGVGELVGTIKSILGYIAELFYHYKDTTKIRAIIADSQKKYQDAAKGKRGNYVKDAKQFYNWYKGVVEDMPIVSSYALANPLTGNYHGFLSLLSKEGETVTDNQLKKNLKSLDTLKDTARTFIQKHSVKLTCDRTTDDGKIVGLALDVVNGKDVIPALNSAFQTLQLPDDWEALIDEFNRYMRKEKKREEEEVDDMVDEFNKMMREEEKKRSKKDKKKQEGQKGKEKS